MVMVNWKSIQDIAEDILYNNNEDDIADATIIREIMGECDAVEVEAASVTIDRFQQQQVSLPYQHNPRTNYNNNSQQQQQQQVVDNYCIVDNNSTINGNGRITGRHNYIAGKNAYEFEAATVTPAIVDNTNSSIGTGRIHDPDRHNDRPAGFFYSRADENVTFYMTCLYNLLQTSDKETKTRATKTPIIAWTPDGLSFRVFTDYHGETAIIDLFQAHHFKFGQYQSFLKKLNLYNFKQLTRDCYTHPLFRRGRPDLFSKITLHEFQQAARNSNRHRIDVLLQEFGRPGTVYYGCIGGPIAVTRDGTLCQNCSMSTNGKLCSQHAHLAGDHTDGTSPQQRQQAKRAATVARIMTMAAAARPPSKQQEQQQKAKRAATLARLMTMAAVAAAARTKKRTAGPSLDEHPARKKPSRVTIRNTSTSSSAIATGEVIPRRHDIICGQGSHWNKNPGTVWYRTLIERYVKEHPVLAEQGKTHLADLIFQATRAPLEKEEDSSSSSSSCRRRRFLQRNKATDRWYEISEEKAKDKTQQALWRSLRQRDNSTP